MRHGPSQSPASAHASDALLLPIQAARADPVLPSATRPCSSNPTQPGNTPVSAMVTRATRRSDPHRTDCPFRARHARPRAAQNDAAADRETQVGRRLPTDDRSLFDASSRSLSRRPSGPVLWSTLGLVARWHPLETRRTWVRDAQGIGMDSGHFLPQEAPEEASTYQFLYHVRNVDRIPARAKSSPPVGGDQPIPRRPARCLTIVDRTSVSGGGRSGRRRGLRTRRGCQRTRRS